MHSQVAPTVLSDSFPSSIWLMGAGEREQGAAPPPRGPPGSIHSTPSCSLVPAKRWELNENLSKPASDPNRPNAPLMSVPRHLSKGQEAGDILEYLLGAGCHTCTHPLLSFTERIGRAWIPESGRPTRLPAGAPSVPPCSRLTLGINVAFTSKTVVRIQ